MSDSSQIQRKESRGQCSSMGLGAVQLHGSGGRTNKWLLSGASAGSTSANHCPFYTTTQRFQEVSLLAGHLTSVSATEVGKGLNPKGKLAKGPTCPSRS